MSVTLGAHREPVYLSADRTGKHGGKHAWACADCNAVYGSKTAEETARRCCAEMLCDCGLRVQKNYTKCDRCITEASDAKEQAIFDKAKKIPWQDYDGDMVYSDRQEYYPDVDSMVDAEDDPPEEPPRWAWACTPLKMSFNASDLVQDKLGAEEHHEEAYVGDDGIKELQTFLDKWCEKHPVESFFPDYSRVVTCDDIVDERLEDLSSDEDQVSEGK